MWLTVALFFLLSPGVLITIPGNLSPLNEQTALISVLIHAVIFGAALIVLKQTLKDVRIEGFQDKNVEGWKLGSSCGTEYCMTPKEYCKENESGVRYCSETQ
jgi:hypothetical protein